MNVFAKQTNSSALNNKSDGVLNHLETIEKGTTASSFWGKCFRRSISSVVVVSYLTMTTAQTMAMDKVHPEGYATPKKLSAVVPHDSKENQDSPISIVGAFEVEDVESSVKKNSNECKTDSNESKSDAASKVTKGVVVVTEKDKKSLAYKLEACRVAFEVEKTPQTWGERFYQVGEDLWKTAYLAGTFTVDSIINVPAHTANAGIWVEGSARKLFDKDQEMPSDDAYYKLPLDFYRDDSYYGGKKDRYMQNLISTALFGGIVYHSTMAEANVSVYTGFDVLANIPYFYEEFFYNHGDDRYYYLNKVRTASLIFSWLTLPFFTRYQCNEFSKNIWPRKEEMCLYENFGFYSESVIKSFVMCSAVAAGLFLAWDYYVAVSRLKDTNQVSDADFNLYPAFLAVSFAITMFNIKLRTTKDQYRDFTRYYSGDKAGFERGIVSEAINFYEESLEEKFKEKSDELKIAHEEQLVNDQKLSANKGVDVEAQFISSEANKVQTVFDTVHSPFELEEKLSLLNGDELLIETLNHWFNHKPKVERKGHDFESIQKLRDEHDAPPLTKLMIGVQKSVKWTIKNSYWILPMLVCIPVATVAYGSFVNNAQLALPQDSDAINEMDQIISYKAQLKILNKYEDKILSDPVKWQTRCFDSMVITENVTDDTNFYAYYYAEANNHTADYMLHFTTPYCLGIQPGGEWIFGPGYLDINYDNAVHLYNGWKNVLTAYSEVKISPPVLTKATKNTAIVGGGFYTAGIYSLSVLSLGPVFQSLMDPKLSVCSKALSMLISTPAFIQGMVKAAPQGIEAFTDIDGNFQKDFEMDHTSAMGMTVTWAAFVAFVTALTLVPDFYTIQKENLEGIIEKIYGRNSLNHISRSFNSVKRLIDTSKSEILSEFYKNYKK